MYKFKEQQVPNQLTEMTVKEWEQVNMILQSSEELIDKYFKIFGLFGIKEEEFNDMTTDDFAQMIVEYNTMNPEEIKTLQEIELDGYTYESFDIEKGVPIRDLKYIEKAFKTGMTDRIAFMLAVIFKRTDLTKTEHYTEAHIKHKTKMFSSVQASVAFPFVGIINEELQKVFNNVTGQNDTEPTDNNTEGDSKDLESDNS